MENDLIIAERQEAYKTLEDLSRSVLDFKSDVERIFSEINKHIAKLGEMWDGDGYERLKDVIAEQIKKGNLSLNNAAALSEALDDRAKEVKEFIEFIKEWN